MWTPLVALAACTDTASRDLPFLEPDSPPPAASESPPEPTEPADTSAGSSSSSEPSGGEPEPEVGDSGGGGAPPTCSASEVSVAGLLPPGLQEVSGMAVSQRNPGVAWVVEDSGNEADVYAIGSAGSLLAAVQLDVPNRDFEDLSIGPCGGETCVWVADIGDNAATRDQVALYRFVEPHLGADSDYRARPDTFAFRYPGGPRNAEALVVSAGGVPFVLTKREDGTSEVYRVPLDGQGVAEAELVATLVITVGTDMSLDEAKVTGAALWPDDRALLVRSYGALWMYDLGGGWGSLGQAPRVSLPVAAEPQGEVVAWDATANGYWTTSEGEGQPLHFAGCGS